MPDNKDRYDFAYADKLWSLLPEIYRAYDSGQFGVNGPLREMVNRIGAQVATVRRSIDRLWEDQSIESCDDWVIPYIADLLATNLISSLDARGQRLDVARTIYFRQRKGTVAILEEIAADVTGWNVKVVEFFRRLARTRHNFDPPIGLPSATSDPAGNLALQRAEGLVGPFTQTGIGGVADLRNTYGASRTQTAFDEYFHTVDVRAGRGKTGWQNIPNLGVFLWRLYAFAVPKTNPVAVTDCPGQFVMDPTGRRIQLFAAAARAYGSAWQSPAEWQLPTPIDTLLLETYLDQLYAGIDLADGITVLENSLGIFVQDGTSYDLVTVGLVTADPEQTGDIYYINPAHGLIAPRGKVPEGAPLVTYCYGFSSTIGAGPYDRRVLGETPISFAGPGRTVAGGGGAVAAALSGLSGLGTVTIGDSLTYNAVADVPTVTQLMVTGANEQRPVIRLQTANLSSIATWTLNGAPGAPGNPNAQLVLDGLLFTGGEIVLTGTFDTVLVRCCTLDPGQWNDSAKTYDAAADGQLLVACRLRIGAGADIRQLLIDRSIVGPIVVEGDGRIELLLATDSIIQGIGTDQAIVSSIGTVNLARTTVLGRMQVHRLDASECILDDIATVDDLQHGCLRFSAWATGSALPRQYECVQIPPHAPLFTSRRYGDAGYAQLTETADNAIVPPSPAPPAGSAPPTIIAGAQNGSEMGAFSREMNPIKERSLFAKYEEYMPIGLTPILIRVT